MQHHSKSGLLTHLQLQDWGKAHDIYASPKQALSKVSNLLMRSYGSGRVRLSWANLGRTPTDPPSLASSEHSNLEEPSLEFSVGKSGPIHTHKFSHHPTLSLNGSHWSRLWELTKISWPFEVGAFLLPHQICFQLLASGSTDTTGQPPKLARHRLTRLVWGRGEGVEVIVQLHGLSATWHSTGPQRKKTQQQNDL